PAPGGGSWEPRASGGKTRSIAVPEGRAVLRGLAKAPRPTPSGRQLIWPPPGTRGGSRRRQCRRIRPAAARFARRRRHPRLSRNSAGRLELLGRLLRRGRLPQPATSGGAAKRSVTSERGERPSTCEYSPSTLLL